MRIFGFSHELNFFARKGFLKKSLPVNTISVLLAFAD